MMTPEEINSRITEWCRIDDEFAEFITNCNKVYWMYEAEKVFEQIHKAFASVPVGTRTTIWRIATLTKNGRCLSRTGALSHNSLRKVRR